MPAEGDATVGAVTDRFVDGTGIDGTGNPADVGNNGEGGADRTAAARPSPPSAGTAGAWAYRPPAIPVTAAKPPRKRVNMGQLLREGALATGGTRRAMPSVLGRRIGRHSYRTRVGTY